MANLQKKTEWRIYGRRADFNGLSARFSVSPVIIRLMVNRGVAPEEMGQYLHGTLRDLPDPALLKDLEKAAELLRSSNYSIYQIAEMTGVPNSNYFHRLFRKRHNCTPLEYKYRVRSGEDAGSPNDPAQTDLP